MDTMDDARLDRLARSLAARDGYSRRRLAGLIASTVTALSVGATAQAKKNKKRNKKRNKKSGNCPGGYVRVRDTCAQPCAKTSDCRQGHYAYCLFVPGDWTQGYCTLWDVPGDQLPACPSGSHEECAAGRLCMHLVSSSVCVKPA